jgi:hypothetical protein
MSADAKGITSSPIELMILGALRYLGRGWTFDDIDVGCTFGILKGRWRILKSGVYLRSAMAIDGVWFTCCALHNWLLDMDGLDEQWETGVQSDWEGPLGEHKDEVLPNANQNLRYDTSGRISFGNDVDPNIGSHDMEDDTAFHDDSTLHDGTRIVCKLSQKYFREKLVEHFDIVWRRNEVVWPRRTGQTPPNYP